MEERTLVALAVVVLVANAGFFVFTMTPLGASVGTGHAESHERFAGSRDAWDADGPACVDAPNATGNASTNSSFAA